MSRRLIAVLVALAIAVATLASSAALGSSSTPKGPAKAQKTVDNAQMRYFIVHLHRLLDPDTDMTRPKS